MSDAIVQFLEDARELVKLAEGLQLELEKNDRYVVSLSEIRKTEDIEKLAKRIRNNQKNLARSGCSDKKRPSAIRSRSTIHH